LTYPSPDYIPHLDLKHFIRPNVKVNIRPSMETPRRNDNVSKRSVEVPEPLPALQCTSQESEMLTPTYHRVARPLALPLDDALVLVIGIVVGDEVRQLLHEHELYRRPYDDELEWKT
jgi:hypothetical protein